MGVVSAQNGPTGGPEAGRATLAGWMVVFAVAVLATAASWEPAHDEGVTWTQALGPVVLPDCASRAPVPMGLLFDALGGLPEHGVRDVVESLRSNGMHPPLYYVLLNGWVRVFGIERYAMVLPALLWGCFALLAMARISERMAPGRGSGGFALALLATSPWFVGYSVFARPYTLVMALALGATWAVLEIGAASSGSRRQRRAQWAFVVLSILGLYTLYHYVFVVIWQIVALGLQARKASSTDRRAWASLGWMVAVIAVGFAPWWPVLAAHLERAADTGYYFAGSFPIAQWPAHFGRLLEILLLGQALWSSWAGLLVVFLALLGAVTIPFAILAFRPAAFRDLAWPARSLWWAALVLPLAIVASDLVRDSHTFFISKTSFALLPLILLLLVRASMEIRPRLLRAGMMAAWALLFAIATVGAIREDIVYTTPSEVVTDVLAGHPDSTHRVLVSTRARGYSVPFLLEARKRGLDAVEVVYAGRADLEACLEAAMNAPDTQQVTLVDFKVPYRPQDHWGELPQQLLASRAGARAWEAVFLDPADPRVAGSEGAAPWLQKLREVRSSERPLVITVAPVKAHWFSE